MPGQVSVIHGERFETYSLDEGIETVGDTIKKFGGLPDGVEFRVNGRVVDGGSDLRDGDTIMFISSKTAAGGIKQAS